ncbi:DNA (cytosine-5)-methyltransferase 3B [termite gut metagenome]|uniref:DNA (cytosine-5-)-methyltransferase n=1 Tax=termite gut metagenome TaxID=433724 RepID=A0A5J4QR99_9ZZZZ
MVVLSVFDGMSCGQIALKELGFPVSKYYASEIKDHAIKCTKTNFPNTVHIGDICKVSYKDGILETENGIFEVGKIDLFIGGSPCQDVSNLMPDRQGLAGTQSSLFWEYVRLLHETKPQYFK